MAYARGSHAVNFNVSFAHYQLLPKSSFQVSIYQESVAGVPHMPLLFYLLTLCHTLKFEYDGLVAFCKV